MSLPLTSVVSAMFLLLLPGVALAQTVQIDESRLTTLYDAYVKQGEPDAYLEKRIEDERARIRTLISKEIAKAVAVKAEGEGVVADIPQSITRQRDIVDLLEEMLQVSSVDLQLLSEEESKYYTEPELPIGDTPAPEEFRLTKSHSELLAKKAILEERIGVVEGQLPAQQERLEKLLNQQRIDQFAFIITIVTYLGILLAIILVERAIQRLYVARIQDRTARYALKKIISVVVYGFTGLWILYKLITEHPGVLASFAIIGAGLAVALQDVVKDVVGWMILIQKRHFSLGHRITVGDHTGDIIDIGILRTTMLEVGSGPTGVQERTGKTLVIPNSLVLTKEVVNANTTSDFTKAEMNLTITYGSDWQKAEKILKQILKEETDQYAEQARKQHHKRTSLYFINQQPADSQVFIDLAASGVTFTLRFSVPVGFRRDVSTTVAREILIRFGKEKNVELAYNTTRVYSSVIPT